MFVVYFNVLTSLCAIQVFPDQFTWHQDCFGFPSVYVKYLLSDVLHFVVRKFAGRDGSQSQFEIFLAEIFVSIKVLITYEKTQKIESTSDFDPTQRIEQWRSRLHVEV